MSACTAPHHGSINAYCKHGCRCPATVQAKRRYDKQRLTYPERYRRIPAVGARRRLHALVAIGWSMDSIAARIGESPSAIRKIAAREYVYVPTMAKVTRIYNELSMTPGPSELSRKAAARRGWAPPLAWDDDTIDDPTSEPTRGSDPDDQHVDLVAVEQFCRGATVPLNAAEQLRALHALAARGLTWKQVGQRFGRSAEWARKKATVDVQVAA